MKKIILMKGETMKKIILEVIFYIISILLQILPVIVLYNEKSLISPLYFLIIVPFYLLAGSIYFSIKSNSIINIWRVFPCVISLFISYRFIITYIEDYFLRYSGYSPDIWTYMILKYFYTISAGFVVVGIVIHQVIILIKYKRSKESNNKAES